MGRYEQKAFITVVAESLQDAKQEIDRICQTVEENGGLVSLEDGVPELVSEIE